MSWCDGQVLIKRLVIIFVAVALAAGQARAQPDPAPAKPADPLVRMLIPQDGDTAFSEAMVFARIIMGRTGISFQVEHVPWDRALRIASTQPNVLVAMMSRTADREAHFLWVGQLHRLDFHLYRDRERHDIRISSLADIGRYRLGVVGLHDVVTLYLLEHKLIAGDQLEVAGNDKINMRKLLNDRIDLMVTTDEVVAHHCSSAGVDCSRVFAVMDLSGIRGDGYMAFSSGTADSLLQRTRRAYMDAILDPSLSQIATAALGAKLYRRERAALSRGQ